MDDPARDTATRNANNDPQPEPEPVDTARWVRDGDTVRIEPAPELLVAPPASSIITNENLRKMGSMRGAMQGAQMLGGRGGQQRVHVDTNSRVSIDGPTNDLFEFVTRIEETQQTRRDLQ